MLRRALPEGLYRVLANTAKSVILAVRRPRRETVPGLGRVFRLSTRHGLDMYADPGDHGVGFHIATRAEFEPEVVAAMASTLREGDTVLDIGANIGHHTLVAARLVGSGVVHAFEPHPHNFNLLSHNIALNGLSNVHAHHLAVSDREGEIFISDGNDRHNHGHRVTARSREELRELEGENVPASTVRAVALDAFDLFVDRIDVVKIDIEGHEENAFRGMWSLIERFRPVIFMEYRPLSQAPLLEELERRGYRALVIGPRGELRELDAAAARGAEHVDLKLVTDSAE